MVFELICAFDTDALLFCDSVPMWKMLLDALKDDQRLLLPIERPDMHELSVDRLFFLFDAALPADMWRQFKFCSAH